MAKRLRNRPSIGIGNVTPDTSKPDKSLEKAQSFRKDGNRLLTTCSSTANFRNVYSCYSKCIAHAPAKSREMALAYENLATLLFKWSKYTECLQAIDNCLNSNYPDESLFNIYLMEIECLKIIEEPVKAEEAYIKTLAYIKTKDEGKCKMKRKLKQCYQKQVITDTPFTRKEIAKIWKQFNIKSFNKEISGVSNALALKYSESQGTHYVAERDIKPGEILMKDRPYAMICSVERRYQCCWYCLKSLRNCIPCDYCKDVIFCSEKCKKEAWEEYHHVECKLFAHFFETQSDVNFVSILLTAFRFLVLAINEYGSFQKLREAYNESKLLSSDPRTKGFVDGRLQSDKYLGFINLATEYDDNISDTADLVVMLVMERIVTTTTLFGNKDHLISGKLTDDEDFVFATDIFKKHMLISMDYLLVTSDVMTCLSLPGSLFNHSCVPNAIVLHMKEFTKVVAQSPIKKGEQVYLTYLGYGQKDKEDRQHILWKNYKFHCNCKACTNNWPLPMHYPKIIEQPEKYLSLLESYQKAVEMLRLLFENENAYTSQNFRKNYKHMMDTLTKTSEAIVKLDTNAPQPCNELAELQRCLLQFCTKLHRAFL